MNHIDRSETVCTASRLTDEGLANAGTLGIVTASLMAILILFL